MWDLGGGDFLAPNPIFVMCFVLAYFLYVNKALVSFGVDRWCGLGRQVRRLEEGAEPREGLEKGGQPGEGRGFGGPGRLPGLCGTLHTVPVTSLSGSDRACPCVLS